MTTYLPARGTAMKARAVCAVGSPAGLVIPNWQSLSASVSASDATGPVALQGVFATNPVINGLGFSSCASPGTGAIYLLTYTGTVLYSPPGTPNFQNYMTGTPLPQGETYIGIAVVTGPIPYVVAASGRVFNVSGGSAVEIAKNFAVRVSCAVSYSTVIYAVSPSAGTIVALNPGNSPTPHATPMANPTHVAIGSGPPTYAVAGTSPAVQPGGKTFAAATLNQVALLDANAGAVTLLLGADPSYQAQPALTGLAGASTAAWSADGTQLLVAQNGGTSVLQLSAGALSVAQTLSPTGVSQITLTPVGDQALLVQPGSGAVAVLQNSLDTWSVGSPVSVSGVNCIAMLSNVTAAVGTSSGVSYLVRTGNTWAVQQGTAVSIPVSISSITPLPNGSLLIASVGELLLLTGSQYTTLVSWNGTTDAVAVAQGQIIVLDKTAGLVRWFDMTGQARGTNPAGTSPASLALGPTSLWLSGSAGAAQYQFYGPFNMRPLPVGQLAVTRDMTTWSTLVLGVGFNPAGLTWNGSTVLLATEQNDLVSAPVTGNPPTLGTPTMTPIVPYAGQDPTASVGIGALTAYNGHVYAPTYASGYVAEVV